MEPPLIGSDGVVFAALALRVPKIRVEISPDGVLVREWAPLWERKRQFAPKNLTVSNVVKNEDNEGVSYTCSLLLPGKESIILAQSVSSHEVERMRIDLISALMTAERRAQSKARLCARVSRSRAEITVIICPLGMRDSRPAPPHAAMMPPISQPPIST